MIEKLRNMTSVYLYDDNKRMLMLYRIGSRAIKDSYIGTAGGHVENDELNNPRASVLRELEEETGLTIKDIKDLELKYITIRYKKNEARQNYYFFAKLKDSNLEINSNEGNLKWFTQEEIAGLDMPHTAKYMIKHYIEKGQFDDNVYAGVAVPEGVQFIKLESFE
ncbi:MAG: NUDIX domain-containing protein [Clostridia bacterium]|nr:NUDIX domain-containing protein [Clostridia bacterium]